jgi:hypothetical protein
MKLKYQLSFMKTILTIIIISSMILSFPTFAQQTAKTTEDSVNQNTSQNSTSIGGYGDAIYQNNLSKQVSVMDLERVVLFVGHNFGDVSFFSELEVENARVSNDETETEDDETGIQGNRLSTGESEGEVSFEQAYLKFNLDQNHYITTGLFLPTLGIQNVNHLPNSFNGNERTQVETYIIPTTWRELGIGFYGSLTSFPLDYSIAVVNGLNSGNFVHGSGIREGEFEGQNATANNLAVTGAVQLYQGNFKLQLSGYYGGSVGLRPHQADSLQLSSGMFGTPIALGEADIIYEANGLSFKALGTVVSIPDAYDINRAYANNTPQLEYGAYAEVGYNLLYSEQDIDARQLIVFARYEKLDMNAQIPSNGIIDGTLNQSHVIIGLNYLPIRNIIIKADVRYEHTGGQNPALIINPSPLAPVYRTDQTFLNLGVGFSF